VSGTCTLPDPTMCNRPSSDAGIADAMDSATTCVPQCNIDADCANTCGTPPTGDVYCCDTQKSTCMAVAGSSCPGAVDP